MSRLRLVGSALVLLALLPSGLRAQRVVNQAERVISVSRGASALLVNPVPLTRFSVGDPAIAEASVLSPTEVLINGKGLGTTTLLIWDNTGQVRVNSVEVTADAPGLQRFLKQLMPDEDIQVSASGNTVTVSGTVKDPNSVARAVDVAKASGATVIDNLVAPPAVQILVRVRFAEINRTVLRDWAAKLSTLNPQKLSDKGNYSGATVPSGGANTITFLLNSGNANVQALIQAATQKGDLRTLAEPNLMTLPGKEAYFLAGGEFPYPSVQSGSSGNAVSIVFKEFGVRLRFTPNIARNGAIRLKLAPEVSTLDFANGLSFQGFQIPCAAHPAGRDRGRAARRRVPGDRRTARQRDHPQPYENPDSGRHSDTRRTVQVARNSRPPDGAAGGGETGAGAGQRRLAEAPHGRARTAAPAGRLEARGEPEEPLLGRHEPVAGQRCAPKAAPEVGDRRSRRMRTTRRGLGNEQGSVLVLVAVTLVGVLAFAAFAIDLASLRDTKGEAQRAADAIALAGASAFRDFPSIDDATKDSAWSRGLAIARLNQVRADTSTSEPDRGRGQLRVG